MNPVSLTVDVAVVGGGPAGMTAAGRAAASGARVILLEGGNRTGRKLLLTGRKRCNLTCTLPLEDFLKGYGPNGRFLRNAYSRFFSEELVSFLAGIGVQTARERGGRIYPARGGARGVQQALLEYAESSGATVLTGRRVRRLAWQEDGEFVVGGGGFAIRARKVVIATGGASFPWTGSRGDGYSLASSLGHDIEPLRPALVPVRCAESFLPRLEGLRLRNVSLSLLPPGQRRKVFFGEVHFAGFGITGPAVFAASKEIGFLTEKGPLAMEVNLKPALDRKKLESRLLRELAAEGKRRLSQVMEKMLPLSLVPVFLERAAAADVQSAVVTREVRQRLTHLLQAFPLTATDTLPLERAMVTAGGVKLSQVNPLTMRSRIVPGLYFAGEVLDLDGSTGGFNLQAAFSTGFLAGSAAAEE